MVGLWTEATGAPTLGLATAGWARQVLAEEGLERSANIAMLLAGSQRIAEGRGSAKGRAHFRVRPRQLIVIDEA